MIKLEMKRDTEFDSHTLGEMQVFIDDMNVGGFNTLERPWLNNKPSVSCIPKGEYEVELWDSENHPDTFHVKNVKNRSYILIHSGNVVKHSKGCILLGFSRVDIDGDGNQDIGRSKSAMRHLNELIRSEEGSIKLTIK